MKKLILISSILLPLLSTPASAERRQVSKTVDRTCAVNTYVEFGFYDKYCRIIETMCFANKFHKVETTHDCWVDQIKVKQEFIDAKSNKFNSGK